MPHIPERYKPSGTVKSGGFGHVYICDDQVLSRPVAIKFIQSPSDKNRLLDEISALQKLRSKHVVQIYDIIDEGDGPFGIVEEFINGDDLLHHPFPKASTENYLKTLWQISSGVADVHEANIIHRDIKPNNINLDGEMVVKIFDFGLAREEGRESVTKGFTGTPGYAAPELIKSETVAFTRAIDVYAFGATSYFLLGKGLPSELLKIPPEPLKTEAFADIPISIPTDVVALLAQCLSQDPGERPKMSVVRDAVARHLLRNKHQALMVHGGKASLLNGQTKVVQLELKAVGRVEIGYDGLRFNVRKVEGEVYINNDAAEDGMELPGSCVVALGVGSRPLYERAFITFDVSNPEVVV